MLSVLQQIGKAPPEKIGTVLSQLKSEASPIGIHNLFPTINTKDIGTSAPVQEVQQTTVEPVAPKAKSILEQLLPNGNQTTVSVQAEAQVQQETVAVFEAPKQASPLSSLFGGQLQIGS